MYNQLFGKEKQYLFLNEISNAEYVSNETES